MALLAIGLLIFLGVHSIRMAIPEWRERKIDRLGEGPWKGLYSLASLFGFALIIVGFGDAGVQDPIWQPPFFMRHVTALLVLIAFILIAAAYVPGSRIKPALGHPMVLGLKSWAFGHLLSNGQPRDLLLFGAFLVWSVIAYTNMRRRDRAAGVVYPAGTLKGDVIVVAVGVIGWALFAFVLHGLLIGVRPLG